VWKNEIHNDKVNDSTNTCNDSEDLMINENGKRSWNISSSSAAAAAAHGSHSGVVDDIRNNHASGNIVLQRGSQMNGKILAMGTQRAPDST